MPPFSLRDVLASSAPAHRDDTRAMKRALGRLGHYKFRDHESDHEPSPYPNVEMFEGLRKFQKQVGLRPDGAANPNGPTAQMLNAVLKETSGGAKRRPAFRLTRPIGAKSANDESDLKGSVYKNSLMKCRHIARLSTPRPCFSPCASGLWSMPSRLRNTQTSVLRVMMAGISSSSRARSRAPDFPNGPSNRPKTKTKQGARQWRMLRVDVARIRFWRRQKSRNCPVK